MTYLLFAATFLFFEPLIPDSSGLVSEFHNASQDSVQTDLIMVSGDIFWDSDWSYFSLDRVSFRVNTGDFGYYGPQPEYLLDEIPLDRVFLGMNLPQAMPVQMNQISRVYLEDGIGTVAGYSYQTGVIHLQSYPLNEGFSVHSSAQFGHNSGEPGPWILDRQKTTPNIDRFGQWLDAGISYKKSQWYLKAHLQRFSFLNSNSFVQHRIRNLLGFPDEQYWPDGRSTTLLGFGETGFQSDHMHLRLQGIRSNSEEFLFFQPLGREIPTDLENAQLTAALNLRFGEYTGMRAMAQLQEKETGYRRNRPGDEFNWKQNQMIGRVSFFLNHEDFNLDVGTEYKNINTVASGLRNGKQQYLKLFLDQNREINSRLQLGSYAAATLHEEEISAQVRGDLIFNVTGKWLTGVEGMYSELLPEEATPVNEWISSGYDILDRLEIIKIVPEQLLKTRLVKLSHRQTVRFSEKITMIVKLEHLNHLQFQIPFQDAYYDFEYSVQPGGYLIFPDVHGQRLKGSLETKMYWSDRFQQSIGFHKAGTLKGLPAYRSYWETIPKNMIRHTSIYKPYPDIEMRLNIGYQSKTEWKEYRRLDGALNRSFNVQFPFQLYRYRNTLETGLLVNLTISKWFWEQRLKAVFRMQNIFNTRQQLHPLAAREKFGYFARIELRL